MLGQGVGPLGGVVAGELAKVGKGVAHSVIVMDIAENRLLLNSEHVILSPLTKLEPPNAGKEKVAANGEQVTEEARIFCLPMNAAPKVGFTDGSVDLPPQTGVNAMYCSVR